MFELTKLKAAHLFTNSRRLANQIRKAQKHTDEQEQAIERQLQDIHRRFSGGGRPRDIYHAFDEIVTDLRRYYSSTIYKQEEGAELYILREEEDMKQLYTGLRSLFEHLKTALPEDREDISNVAELLNQLYQEGVKFKDKLQKEFRKIRDQKRDHERFRDKIYNLRKDFQQRAATKHLRKDVQKRKKETKAEKHGISSLEHHLKRIEQLKRKQATTKHEEKKLHSLIDDLAQDLGKDLQLLEETLRDVATIIDYAVYHYFKAQDLKELIIQEATRTLPSKGMWASTELIIKQLFDDLNQWQDQQERREYRIGKKVRKQARKDTQQKVNA
ncbi:hypothetical protein GF367_01675 [Candidatus Woesearchaeota archaeon]|nr:hypothetical protein [Candidatus Woesearchaeota archaeon]